MSKLYVNLESLDVLEQLNDKEYSFIYMDVPYYTGSGSFELFNGEKSIRHRISELRGIPIGEVTKEAIEEEKKNLEKEDLRKYSEYISRVIENAYRVLKDDGILAFLTPSHEYVDINYRLILDQFFPSFSVVTIENRKKPVSIHQENNYNLFFYSKKEKYVFPVLKELRSIDEFPEKDEYDYFKKRPATKMGRVNTNMVYQWNGVIPSGNRAWRYTPEKMDKMYAEGRILIEGDNVWIKCYRSEYPEVVSSVWKYTDKTRFPTFIDSQSIERMFSMFVKEDSKVLCPYDRDGKFSYMADNLGVSWEAVYLPCREDRNLIKEIPENHYEVIDKLQTSVPREYKNGIVTNISDIADLRNRLEQLSEDVKSIQTTIGLDDDSEFSVNTVVEQIHKTVTQALSSYSIEGCLPEARAWIDPFWDKLEPESKHFIPTGLLLYKQFNAEPNVDMAPIMIEYCKALEKEMFKKMYYGYINDLINRNINLRTEFPVAFTRQNTSVFAEFLSDCMTTKKDNPKEWKFEMGKMVFVLQSALGRHPRESIIIDFRDYLNRVFEYQFFREQFSDRLHFITKLRNDCAHPSIIDNAYVEEGKELIRKKLLMILKYYTEL